MFSRLILVTFFSLVCVATVCAQTDTTVLRPKEIDEVLVNPGMGIETFQRFNGDAINPGLGWSEEGPIGKLAPAAGAVDFPTSSISYCRWFWETLEPEQGKVRWEILDAALREAHAHHQALAIRLMPYDREAPAAGMVPEVGGAAREPTRGQRRGNLAAGLCRPVVSEVLGSRGGGGREALRRASGFGQRGHLLRGVLG